MLESLYVDLELKAEFLAHHTLQVLCLLGCSRTIADKQDKGPDFTAEFLASRGYCCESGCRHCPFID